MPTSTPKGSKTKEPVLSGAVDLARAAALEVADSATDVGEHVSVAFVDERLVAHHFACNLPGYVGWEWVVTLARIPRGRVATVCEVELLPATGALLAPEWVPWSQRLQPGDIGPGDVLPFTPDDERLTPGYQPTGKPEEDAVAIDELALARVRVLSQEGRKETAQRWYRGSHGPASAAARASREKCRTCGFFVALQGPLGGLFGACANEWSPDDGLVVSSDHGCGAHSESDVAPAATLWPSGDPMIDDFEFEDVSEPMIEAEAPSVVEPAPSVVEPVETTVSEDLSAEGLPETDPAESGEAEG